MCWFDLSIEGLLYMPYKRHGKNGSRNMTRKTQEIILLMPRFELAPIHWLIMTSETLTNQPRKMATCPGISKN